MRFPKGYDEAGSEAKERLLKEQIIYEVELVDFVERYDCEANGTFLKYFIKKPGDLEW